MSALKLALVACLALLATPGQDAAPNKFDAADLAKLSWLAGTWELRDGATVTEEHWLPLAGSSMMGLSHTYDDKSTRFFEYLRITRQNGTIAYVAQPGGGTAVPFLAAKLDDKEAVFENPAHDHPQRIRYERTDAGVTATISMLDGSRASSFVFKRRDK